MKVLCYHLQILSPSVVYEEMISREQNIRASFCSTCILSSQVMKQGRLRILKLDLTRYLDTIHSSLAASRIFQTVLHKVCAEPLP